MCYQCGRPAWVMSAQAAVHVVMQALLQEAAVRCGCEVGPFLKAPDVMAIRICGGKSGLLQPTIHFLCHFLRLVVS